MTVSPAAPLALFDEDDAPVMLTDLPGPRSAELWAADSLHHAVGSSPPSRLLKMVVSEGSGALIRDVDGNVLIDLSSGVVVTNLGHSPPSVVAALREEVGKMLHFFDFATPSRPAFFDALAATLPPQLGTFQMYTTGAEAVEAAIKAAKSYTGNYEVVCFDRAWHGRTLGTMSLMGASPLKHGYGPFAPGVVRSFNAYCYRCPLGLDRQSCAVECAAALDRRYEESGEGRLAAVIIEPVQGVGGVIPHPPEFLAHLRRYCDEKGALLIFDEILTGAGRTGTMWAFEQSGVVPDVLLAGKGVGSGYPLSVVASRREVLDSGRFGMPGAGASTFASGNLACAAGAATLAAMADGAVIANAARVGRAMSEALLGAKERHRCIGDVRGAGLLLGVELVSDPDTKAPPPPDFSRRILVALARRGAILGVAGPVLRITPPLVISERLALRGVQLLEEALTAVESGAE